MSRALALLFLLVGAPTQRAVMVWDSRCLSEVRATKDTKLVAPLKDDGTPDMKQAKVLNTHVTYDPSCGRIEIQKEQ